MSGMAQRTSLLTVIMETLCVFCELRLISLNTFQTNVLVRMSK
jgi:hypothetical protein